MIMDKELVGPSVSNGRLLKNSSFFWISMIYNIYLNKSLALALNPDKTSKALRPNPVGSRVAQGTGRCRQVGQRPGQALNSFCCSIERIS